jgi:hypothetical protein
LEWQAERPALASEVPIMPQTQIRANVHIIGTPRSGRPRSIDVALVFIHGRLQSVGSWLGAMSAVAGPKMGRDQNFAAERVSVVFGFSEVVLKESREN